MALAINQFSPCQSSWSFQGFSSSNLFKVNRGEARVVCRKKDIHPKYYNQAKVYCKGEQVMVTGGTQPEYVVDVWSGNHPFYQGNRTTLLLDADRVEKFKKRYGSLTSMSTVPVLKHGEIIFERQRKNISKGKGKK